MFVRRRAKGKMNGMTKCGGVLLFSNRILSLKQVHKHHPATGEDRNRNQLSKITINLRSGAQGTTVRRPW